MMDKLDKDGKDGLERFFHNKLHHYQDEPGDGLWERIAADLPREKPRPVRNYRKLWAVTGQVAAACLVLALGSACYLYYQQLALMQQQLAQSRQEIASLEARMEGLPQQLPVAVEIPRQETPKVNVRPVVRREVVYVPAPAAKPIGGEAAPAQGETKPKTVEKSALATQKEVESQKENSGSAQHTTPSAAARYRTAAFEALRLSEKERMAVLDLRQTYMPEGETVWGGSRRQLNLPSTQMPFARKDKWAVGYANKRNPIVHASMPWEKDITVQKVVGVGGQYSVSEQASVFMAPEYWNPRTQPRGITASDNGYPLGVNAGVVYSF